MFILVLATAQLVSNRLGTCIIVLCHLWQTRILWFRHFINSSVSAREAWWVYSCPGIRIEPLPRVLTLIQFTTSEVKSNLLRDNDSTCTVYASDNACSRYQRSDSLTECEKSIICTGLLISARNKKNGVWYWKAHCHSKSDGESPCD